MLQHIKQASFVPGARDEFLICDLPDLADLGDKIAGRGGHWCGGLTAMQSAKLVRDGDLSGVPASDKFLAEMESLVPVSLSWRTINDVVGGVPDVPSFLAGHPLSMRRRQRIARESAPLAIFAELTSSAGVSAADLTKRGSAILALVRVLSNLRPVELWAVCGLGSKGRGNFICTRIDTAPLDLARAAHVLTHPSVARGICYGALQDKCGSRGAWPYDDIETVRKHGREILSRVIQPGSEALYIPPIYLRDECITNPVKWIKDKLAAYGGVELETA